MSPQTTAPPTPPITAPIIIPTEVKIIPITQPLSELDEELEDDDELVWVLDVLVVEEELYELVDTPNWVQIFFSEARCVLYLLTLKSYSMSKVSIILVAAHASSRVLVKTPRAPTSLLESFIHVAPTCWTVFTSSIRLCRALPTTNVEIFK